MQKNKIKVLHMIGHMNDGGAQRIVLNYLGDLSNDNDIEIKVLVYGDKTDSYCNRIIEEKRYNVDYLFRNNHNRYIRKIKKILFGKYILKKYIKDYKPDIIHIHISSFLMIALNIIKKSKVSIRFDTLHSNPYRFKGATLKCIKEAFQKDNFIGLCVTKEQALQAKDYYGLKKYEIIRNGIDIRKIKTSIISKESARKRFNIPEDVFVVIGVGRLDKIKRFDLLVDAYYNIFLSNKKSMLLIAGEGIRKKSLLEQIKKLGIEDNVKFLGNLDNIVPLYCAADVMGITSFSESSSLVLLEAQVCGLRCVISDGVPEESIFTTNVEKMSENANAELWAQALVNVNFQGKKVCNESDYDVHDISKKMKKIYLKYWEEFQNGK